MLEKKYKTGKNPNSRNGWKKGENYPGMSGKHHTKETKEKLSKIKLEKPIRYWLGKKRPDIAKNMRERIVSEETKRKMSEASKGQIAWNKGLKMPQIQGENHPMWGKHHSEEAKRKMSGAHKGHKVSKETRIKISNSTKGIMPKNLFYTGSFGNIARGWYEIAKGKKMFFRSKWEANIALYLNFLVQKKEILKWEYESETFIFSKIKFGTRSYRPDFRITNNDDTFEYWEVKGYMTPRSKTQINRMRIYYPNIKLVIIDEENYKNILAKIGKMLNFY